MGLIQYRMGTKIGPLFLVASEDSLQSVSFAKHKAKMVRDLNAEDPSQKILLSAARQLEEYFEGKRQGFQIALNFSGTPFQNRVWKQLAKIPYGKTVSYRGVAQKIKNPRAVRAVGSANGKNPFCIIIPCHRVIAADGTIGGYAGGSAKKEKLLQLEQA